jgi:hypothetical protein
MQQTQEKWEMNTNYWSQYAKEKDHLRDLGIDGLITLNAIKKK